MSLLVNRLCTPRSSCSSAPLCFISSFNFAFPRRLRYEQTQEPRIFSPSTKYNTKRLTPRTKIAITECLIMRSGGPKRKLCAERGCPNQPSYANSGTKIPIFCLSHAKGKDLVLVKRKRCAEDGCLTAPGYGMENSAAQYCARHAKPGMVDVKNKKCLGEGCRKAPSYGVPNTR